MRKSKLFAIIFMALTSVVCLLFVTGCYSDSKPTHKYSSVLSYDDDSHWYACIDEGYEDLKSGEQSHTLTETSYDEATGEVTFSCMCGYSKKYLRTVITTLPTVECDAYIGQRLSDVALCGGEANVDGVFTWSAPDTLIESETSEYDITFTPSDSQYAVVTSKIQFTATQLSITVTVGENGSSNYNGSVNVNFGDELTVTFTANNGFAIDTVTVDGESATAVSSYTFENITVNHTISVEFKRILPDGLTVNYLLGTKDAFTYDMETEKLTFTTISEKTSYSISGEFNGNIVIDVGDDYKFELEMQGLKITCSSSSPIIILSGDKVTLTAKKDCLNYVYDTRVAVGDDDTQYSSAIYSKVDLTLGGKGYLEVISDNNNGVHTKDDLEVKNLNLYVKCVDNALKGNDSVSILSGNLTLIARQGDCIKTKNTDVSSKGKQRGSVIISGGTLNLYSACDGIDAAYNVEISQSPTINVYTDKYSEYSEEVTDVSQNEYYLRYTSSDYKYSVKYYNSDTDYVWVNVGTSYETVTSSGFGQRTYYYYTFAKQSNYSKMIVYMYNSSQTQGSDTNYYACSSVVSVNENYDTLSLSLQRNSISVSWTNYTTTTDNSGQFGPGGMGGMFQDEGNKDKGDYSTKGIKADNEIIISGGTICIKSYDDAIHANNDNGVDENGYLENGVAPTGNITISGGKLTLYSNDDGIHADGILNIVGGEINITNSYEGLEGEFIKISDGVVSVISSDDGLNATTTSGHGITISGGTIYVYAEGDGLDSNSTDANGGILFEGGYVAIVCNSNGNSAIDTENGYTHTGGCVVAIMTSGGMTHELTNGNSAGITEKSNLSLSENSYVTVTVGESMVAIVKMPCAMTAYTIYLGSNNATISSTTTTEVTLDNNGVYWNK